MNDMKICCITALTTIGLLGSSAILAANDGIQIDSAKYRLGDATCGTAESLWELSSGPNTAIIVNSGDESFVEMFESGSYQFERTCCEAANTQSYGSPLPRVNALLASADRMGYGANTTGGAEATEYTKVTSLADSGSGSLREALLGDTPVWIIFDESIHGGTITLKDPINVQSGDVTIDGAGADITLTNDKSYTKPRLVFRGGNTIIHGITLDGNQTSSHGLMMREGDNYWVDHVTITNNDGDDAMSVGQGNRGDSSASEVTISNYHTYNTTYGFLAGGEDDVPVYPTHRITIHSSNLSARDRNPRIKNNGEAHLFNNYVHSFKYVGAHSGTNTVLYTENNIFSATNAKTKNQSLGGGFTKRLDGEPGVVYSSGDMLIDGAKANNQVFQVSANEFNLPYEYSVRPVDEVKAHVLANAGASNAPNPDDNPVSYNASNQTTCSVNTRSVVYNKR